MLCGAGLGLLLVLVPWWFLHAEGEEFQGRVRVAQAEAEEQRPIIREVRGLKARRESLESLIIGLLERPKLFQATEAVLTAAEPDVVLERLEVSGLETRILARADDERTVERFIDSLRESGAFLEVSTGDGDRDDAPVPPRFEVRGELRPPWAGVEE